MVYGAFTRLAGQALARGCEAFLTLRDEGRGAESLSLVWEERAWRVAGIGWIASLSAYRPDAIPALSAGVSTG